MADRAILENGISIKLCDLCTSNKDFLKRFLNLFDNIPKKNNNITQEDNEDSKNNIDNPPKDVDYIYFSGSHETGNGKPDITIRFEDGSYFYIEVKTNAKTEFQQNQLDGYEKLINTKGQKVENSFAFLLDKTHVYKYQELFDKNELGFNNEKSTFHFVTWNDVLDLINTELEDLDFKKRLQIFKEDLINNVDALDDSVYLTEGEFKLLSDPMKMQKYRKFLQELETLDIDEKELNFSFLYPTNCNSNNLNNHMAKHNIYLDFTLQASLTKDWLPNFGYYVKLEKQLEEDLKKKLRFEKSIFIGFNYSVLSDNNFIEMSNDEYYKADYFFSISIESDLLDISKIKSKKCSENTMMLDSKKHVRFCKDTSNWCYFPLQDLLQDIEEFNLTTFSELFKTNIHDRLKFIFENFLPDNSCNLNFIDKSTKEEKKVNGTIN